MKSILLLVFTLMITLPAYSERVCSVYDGDTLTTCEGMKVRLWGVDAPELKQPIGRDARDYLRRLVEGREVRLDCNGKSYKRSVCRVFVVLPAGQMHAGRELVGRGLAFDSPVYSGGAYKDAEAFARMLKRGVWIQPDGGVKPWDWREAH